MKNVKKEIIAKKLKTILYEEINSKKEAEKELEKELNRKPNIQERTSFNDIKPIFQELINFPEKILRISDKFNFNQNNCLKCSGLCCTDKKITISPPEFDVLIKSPFLRRLNRTQIIKKFFKLSFDSFSAVPFLEIKFISRKIQKTPHEICSFWKWKKKKQEFGGICVLGQKYKPTTCLLYPLGLINLPSEKILFFFDQKCEYYKSNKKIKVRDFIQDWIKPQKNKIAWFNEVQEIIRLFLNLHKNYEETQEFIEKFGILVFYADGNVFEKINLLKKNLKN